MNVADLFRAQGTRLFWRRLPDSQAVGEPTGQLIEPDRAYFVVRLNEMYLGTRRTLWRRFRPLVHGFTTHAGREEHSIAGPGQLQQLGEANLERVVVLNTRLAGPIAFDDGDVSLVVGLYSVPGDDAATALVATVGAAAGLAGLAAGPVTQLADVVKTGVDSILGLAATRLRLGVSDVFFAGNPLRSGFHVGIGTPEENVDVDRLWLRDGRLMMGVDPVVARPYTDHDYMVVQIERREARPDWPGLPGIADFEQRFRAVMGDGALLPADRRNRLAAVWPAFCRTLADSPHLTRLDAGRIAGQVSDDLKARLRAMESASPFETRSWAEATVATRKPADVDFADLPEHFAAVGPEARLGDDLF